MMLARTVLAPIGAAAVLLVAPPAGATCAGRPTDADFDAYSYGGVEARSFASARARVHWAVEGTHAPDLTAASEGVPDSVRLVGSLADAALAKFGELGFRAVPGDLGCPSNGGDDRIDIYLVRFAGGDGATRIECSGAACSSFVLVDSRYQSRGYASAEEGFRTVVTHELFHAVQNAYREEDDAFWSEGTAQWAMKTVHPDLRDFERQLPPFFAVPSRSLDGLANGVAAGVLYGAAVWPLFLALRHGPDVIRETFEEQSRGQRSLAAVDAVLQRRGSSLAAEFPRFAAWNAATGPLAGAGGYPDAAKYPGVELAELVDGASAITSGLGSYGYRGILAAGTAMTLETDASRNGGFLVPIEGGQPQLDRAVELVANTPSGAASAPREVLVVVAGITTKRTDAPFALRIGTAPPPAKAEDSGCNVGARAGEGWAWVVAASFALGARLRRRPRRRARDGSSAG